MINPEVLITSTAIESGNTSKAYVYQVKAQTNVNSTIRYSLPKCPTEMTIDSITGLIQWKMPIKGSYEIAVRASIEFQGKNYTNTQQFILVIEDSSAIQIAFVSTPTLKGIVNEAYIYQAKAVSSDTTLSITYRLNTSPNGMAIDSQSGMITWTNPIVGSHPIGIGASVMKTGIMYSTTQNYTLTIEPKQIPLTITFKSSPPLVGMEGKPYTYAVKTVSSDTTKQVTLRLGMNAPSGMTLNAGTNILSWPSPIRGSYPIAIIARIQGDSVIERQSFTLQIQADTTTSVNEDLPLQSSNVFPNPAEHTLRISVPQPMFSFTIMNIIGQHIMSGHSTGSIDISNIQQGMYILLVDNDKPFIEFFVKR